ncbi:MAG: DUF2252 family protein [Myxococcales bacterium]|nr:DUF2252 family protein [Myxococcales bacterium]
MPIKQTQSFSPTLCKMAFFGGLLFLVLLGVCVGCSSPSLEPRDAYLRNLLIEDNWPLLRRIPEEMDGKSRRLLEEKLLLMSQEMYAYFRGTVIVYLRDQTMLYGNTTPTAFGSPDSSYIGLVGDPHPENIGTYKAIDGSQRIDFNDFDAAMYGPFIFDVRRLILGYWIAAQKVGLRPPEKAVQDALASSITGAYFDEIMRLKEGGAPYLFRPSRQHGVLIEDMFARAKRDGDANEDLSDYTRIQDNKRVMFHGVVEADTNGIINDRVGPLDAQEERLLREILRIYPTSLLKPSLFPKGYFTWKAASQRFGSGVSSYPRLRYYILVEGASASLDDDILLEVKEVAEPPSLPGFPLFPKQTFRDNAERVVWIQRQLQEDAEDDAFLGNVSISPMAFRIRQRIKYQKNFSVSRFLEKYQEKKWRAEDLRIFAQEAGKLLARTHAKAPTLQGGKGLEVIAKLLEGKRERFIQEQEDFIRRYGPQTQKDFQQLSHLLDRYGALLGYQAAPWTSSTR